MALPNNVLGLESKLYIGAVGGSQSTLATDSNEVDIARNVDLTRGSTLADVTIRKSTYRLQRRALKEFSVTLGLLYSPASPFFKMLNDAYENGTSNGYFVSDGYGSGMLFDGSVTEFTVHQPLEDGCSVDVTIVPTFEGREPEWVTGSGSMEP